MLEPMKSEAIDIATIACERYTTNYELAAKVIKEKMDQKFGTHWHVIVGEGFGYEITHESKSLLCLFYLGNLAIVCWKC